jgi:hypothetical protein
MTDDINSNRKIPVIYGDDYLFKSHDLFNPNEWPARSRAIINSCAAQYALLLYTTDRISRILAKTKYSTMDRVKDLQKQWDQKTWPIDEISYFVQVPDFHLHIQSFLSTVKSFLDVLAQLLSTEDIVTINVDGFHRRKDVIGGQTLNILKNNAGKKDTASKISDLILKANGEWIVDVVNARDFLVHPEKGFSQIMFQMNVIEKNGQLELTNFITPTIWGKEEIDKESLRIVEKITEFSASFLKLLRNS